MLALAGERLLDLFSIKSDFVLLKALVVKTKLRRTDDMANLRRHFNFTAKQSSLVDQGSVKSLPLHQPDAPSTAHSSKCHLMEDICSCLDLCCSYVQALNALCGAGTLLAGNLLRAVQEVPAYRSIAQQFFAVWNEVGKATAGASAAVKTETLMMMQEALNALEAESEDTDIIDAAVSDSFQVIGSCLFSFIELQAEFSLSTWKSLSKLSKSLPNDAFQNTFRHSGWKHDRSPFKPPKNSELSSTIKKHFSQLSHKYGASKSVDSVNITQSQFYVAPANRTTETMVHGCGQYPGQMGSSADVSDSVVWSPSNTLWSSCNTSIKNVSHSSDSQAQCSSSSHSELDEVINLLSCMPLHTLSSNDYNFSQNTNNYESSIKSQPLRKFWPEGSAPLLSRYMTNTRSWSEGLRDIPFGYDSWIWRADGLNCASLPEGGLQSFHENGLCYVKQKEQPLLWNSFENQRYIGTCENGSSSDDGSSNPGYDADSFRFTCGQPFDMQLFAVSKQRRSSSSSSLPNGSDTNVDMRNRSFWDAQIQKTSTWPLKQSSSKMFIKSEWPPANVQSDSENQPVFYS